MHKISSGHYIKLFTSKLICNNLFVSIICNINFVLIKTNIENISVNIKLHRKMWKLKKTLMNL